MPAGFSETEKTGGAKSLQKGKGIPQRESLNRYRNTTTYAGRAGLLCVQGFQTLGRTLPTSRPPPTPLELHCLLLKRQKKNPDNGDVSNVPNQRLTGVCVCVCVSRGPPEGALIARLFIPISTPPSVALQTYRLASLRFQPSPSRRRSQHAGPFRLRGGPRGPDASDSFTRGTRGESRLRYR
ncbi:hypothetical protein LX32DRAFT_223450 [Colletotrichum zoysiae]|uniref:Uncharacterized protein n=1 Tax=Colletotrichum zoysiae TaxID=1216348 RepID=A0AAD9H3Q8_9PEZI|nr:hypothetical protein LX32DRAFT_223450 [Colletotrichum zoysiae]